MLSLSTELGLSESTVSRWESGEWPGPAEAKTVLRVASFLATDPLELLAAWMRGRGGIMLPALGDERDRAACVLAMCWEGVPATGAVTVTLEPTEPALRLVRS